MAQQPKNVLFLIIFSKNRAFQLSELLRTYLQFCVAAPLTHSINTTDHKAIEESESTDNAPSVASTRIDIAIHARVIYTCSDVQHQAAYSELERRYQTETEYSNFNCSSDSDSHFDALTRFTTIKFLREDCTEVAADSDSESDRKHQGRTQSFEQLLLSTLRECQTLTHKSNVNSFIQFCVDDMLFYQPFDLTESLTLLLKQQDVLSYTVALHDNVSYCHPADQDATRPPDLVYELYGTNSRIFMRMFGTKDWNYPFNLCGSIFRADDVQSIVQVIQKSSKGLTHPNLFEVAGNQAIATLQSTLSLTGTGIDTGTDTDICQRLQRVACCGKAVMSVVTVNRVQGVFENRVYSQVDDTDADADADAGAGAWTPSALLKLFWKNTMYDTAAYAALQNITSVHIGQMLLLES
jgi:hypothetical protein